MNLSYDYEEFLGEFFDEMKEGNLTVDSHILIVRKKEPVFGDYHPIIEWYYIDAELSGGFATEAVVLNVVLEEMEDWNRII
jgi:hypothetical protein